MARAAVTGAAELVRAAGTDSARPAVVRQTELVRRMSARSITRCASASPLIDQTSFSKFELVGASAPLAAH